MENETEVLEEKGPAIAAPASNSQMTQISGAIIVAGIIIAGAILLKGGNISGPAPVQNNAQGEIGPAEVTQADRVLGNNRAKITVILYEDFQCPFCGAVTGFHDTKTPIMQHLTGQDPTWAPFVPEIKKLALAGDVLLVYRDFAFLGQESIWAAEAARCATDQYKFWEYHDYLYSHQDGENEGAFTVEKLKSFAKIMGLDQFAFDQCLDTNKHEQAVLDSTKEGQKAGVRGTPKGFILKEGKVVATIDGAEPWSTVSAKIEAAR